MGEYRRWISYVYGYLNGAKGESAGYVKIECRNGRCKIYTNIKAPYSTANSLGIYVFYRENDKMVLVELGTGSLKKGQCEFTYETEDDNIGGSNLRLEQLGGLVGIVSENRFFGTVWDEKEINLENAVKLADMNKDEILTDGEEQMLEAQLKVQLEVEEEIQEEPIEDIIQEQEITVHEDIKIQENVENNETKDSIERIFARYPGMYPFEDDEIIECVKLEPQDIGIFPMEKWVLANNSFLLHGYYTYRHLIFAKLRVEDVKDSYILGVPGLYRDRERFMAGMFGFDKFKGVRGTERDYGEFGYWYMNMDL